MEMARSLRSLCHIPNTVIGWNEEGLSCSAPHTLAEGSHDTASDEEVKLALDPKKNEITTNVWSRSRAIKRGDLQISTTMPCGTFDHHIKL